MKRTHFGALVIALGVLAAASLAAFGGNSNRNSRVGASNPAGSTVTRAAFVRTMSKSKSVIVFTPATSNNYVAMWTVAARNTLTKAGYQPTFIQNNFDQSQEDSQVQQVLASGKKPAAFIWWPSDNAAGIADVSRLSRIAPVVQTNNKVLPAAEKYVTAFGGVNDYEDGLATGDLALKMRAAFKARGLKLHSPGGNALMVTYGGGYQAGIDRVNGILAATKSAPFHILATVSAGFTVQAAYQAVSEVLPRILPKGIDFVLAVSEFPADGAIQALEQAGLKPGKNVGVITGNCQTNFNLLDSGAEYGTILQSPTIEGETAAGVLLRVLADGGKTQGLNTTETLPATLNTVPSLPRVPAYRTFMPLPLMPAGGTPAQNEKSIASIRLWGQTAAELCAK
jgi:ABC-type sugar transport system substrate-binding protein